MNALVEFLRARLDEDAAVAREATDGPWRATRRADGTHHVRGGASVGEWTSSRTVHRDGGYPVDWPKDVVNPAADADHIARHDPARVLREIEAKRRVLVLHVLAEQDDGDGFVTLRCMVCDPEGSEPFYPCPTLRLLAAVYADHPDYRQGWAPTY